MLFRPQPAAPSPDGFEVLTRAGLRAATRRDWLASRGTVLARSLVRTLRVDLSAVPPAQRRAALRGQLLAWSPFEHSGFLAALRGSQGLGLAWDARAVDAAAGAKARRQWLPEILLQAPAPDGLRLLQGLDGVEAQLWQQSMLVASRWWPQAPGADEWQDFRRETQALLNQLALPSLPTQPPAAQAPTWLRRPWLATFGAGSDGDGLARWERLAFTALGCGLVALTASTAHQAWQAHRQLDELRTEQARLREQVRPVLAARERALDLARRAKELGDAMASIVPIELLNVISQVLPPKGAVLKELDYTESRLVLGLELAPGLQRSTVIGALQSTSWFGDVKELREVPGRNWARFEMRLSGLQAPPLKPMRPAALTGPTSPPGQSAPPLPAASAAAALRKDGR